MNLLYGLVEDYTKELSYAQTDTFGKGVLPLLYVGEHQQNHRDDLSTQHQ